MCGIVGFVRSGAAAPEVLQLLKKLEYRGYDSAGVATIDGDKLWIKKGIGKLDEVQKMYHIDELPGKVGIGHVRWATHGGVTVANSHPHSDCKHQIAVVHNGIIENYQVLRARLAAKHTFTSETDTEVVPHLIEEYMEKGDSLEEAVVKTVKLIDGSYAMLVIATAEPNKIVAVRNNSPLVVGKTENGNFVASDALCFLEETRNVAFLEDGEGAVITEDNVSFFDSEGQPKEKGFTIVDWKWDDVDKLGYDHYMIKEIYQEPQAIRQALVQDKNMIRGIAMDILRSRQVILTASGSSRYAALVGRYLFSKMAGKLCEVVLGSEFGYFSDSIDKNTLVIAISQSGETADVIQGVKEAKKRGATILSLVNTKGSSLARISDKVLYLNCGPEIAVAATKSFTSQLTLFYMLSFAMVNLLDEVIKTLESISTRIEEILKYNGKELPKLAEQTKNCSDFYFIARGINYAIANEGALKLKEVSYIHAEGMSAGELKHGTLSLIEEGTPVVAICPHDYTFTETLSNIYEAKARGAFIIGVSDSPNLLFDFWVGIIHVDEIFYPLVAVVPLQLLAYHLAIARGLDPDQPRNLAKSVTVK
jgi:glucosamine--fructose-6-phosphate aminotransferase (isomerizing)